MRTIPLWLFILLPALARGVIDVCRRMGMR
jgi:hypothetical protein